ncbi:MAG: hypothetical protein JWM11_296 [Planctomycetaceae bacterium]|nr:hypothetical protein [Planctomycetaceae bacterium]
MIHQSGIVWRVIALWAILVGQVMSAAAQEDEPEVDVPPMVVDSVSEFFEHWVFQHREVIQGNRIVHRPGTAIAARDKIDTQLKSTLDELVKACDLDSTQQRKLSLAARGDIKQFFDRVEDVRKKFLAAKGDLNRLNQFGPEISPLQQQYQKGLFGKDSLFAKSLQKTLTGEQQAKYQAVLLERRKASYRAAIDVALARLNGFVLRRDQHDALLKVLLEGTQPPLLFGQYDQQVVMLGLSKLPSEKLKKVLDKGQWKRLQPQLLQASGTEDNLAQHGVIEEPKRNPVVIIRSVRTAIPPQNTQQSEPRTP